MSERYTTGKPPADQLLMQKRFQSLGHDFHIVESADEAGQEEWNNLIERIQDES